MGTEAMGTGAMGTEARQAEARQAVERVAVIGAGAWGTALADLLARKGETSIHSADAPLATPAGPGPTGAAESSPTSRGAGRGAGIACWVRSADVFAAISNRRENAVYLPGHRLSKALRPTRSLEEAAQGADVLVMAVPSHAMREVATRLRPHLKPGVLAVSAAKGIEEGSLQTMTQVLGECLPGTVCAALSGPSFAREVAAGLPTAVTLACRDQESARALQRLFATPVFRVYASQDTVGVELGGAIKNVIAIAAGISDGLGFGHNTRAALITRGLAEMARLGSRLSATAATFAGLAGLGDLVLTCTGDLSRNRGLGLALGRGGSLATLREGTRQVAEGVRTAASLRGLALREGVEMPICEQVWRVLYEGKEPRSAVAELMTRDLKDEGI